MNRKIVAMVTALTVAGGTVLPVYAEDMGAGTDIAVITDTADTTGNSDAADIGEGASDITETVDTADTTETDISAIPEDEAQAAENADSDAAPADEADMTESAVSDDEFTEESGEIPDTAEEVTEDAESTADDTLLEDEEEYLAGDWYSWNLSTGTLTLKGQLLNTYWDGSSSSARDIATLAGVTPTKVKKIIITSGTKTGTSTDQMFRGMYNLTEIQGLSNLDTSSSTTMRCMFLDCQNLTSLDVSGFNTANVTDMKSMFKGCNQITSLDLSSFDTSNVTDMSMMFQNCYALTTVKVGGGWTTAAVTESDSMFLDCSGIKGGAGTVYNSSYTDKEYARTDGGADNPGYLTFSLPAWVKSWDASTGTLTLQNQLPETGYSDNTTCSLAYYAGIKPGAVKKIVVTAGTKTGTSAYYMFRGFSKVTEIQGLGNLDTSECTDMTGMFNGCYDLTSLDLSGFDTSNVTDMKDMFYYCTSLTTLDLSSFDTSKVTNMDGMFKNCSFLNTIKVSGKWSTRAVTDSYDMFNSCSYLRGGAGTVYNSSKTDRKYARTDGGADNPGYLTSAMPEWVKSWDSFAGVLTIQGQLPETYYYGTDHDLANYAGIDHDDVKKIIVTPGTKTGTSANYMFNGLVNLTEIQGLSNLDTSKCTVMAGMFSGCSSLTSLDLSSFDTSKVTDMEGMFYYCSSLTTIKVSDKWSTRAVTDSYDMFNNCSYLRGGAGTVYNSSKTDKEYARVDGGASNPGYLTGEVLEKPTVAIKTAFGGKTVQFNCTDPDAEIYYQTGSSNITLNSKHVKAGTTVFFNTPMTGSDAAIYFKAYKNGRWLPVGKWGLLNVKIDKPIIAQSGKKTDNNFKVYTQTKDSYIVYTLDGTVPSIEEGTQKLTVKNGRIVWGTSTVVNIPKGRTIKAIAIRNGLVTSDVMTYSNK